MYYMLVNIGSLFSMLATPWLAVHYGWSVAFSLSVVGLLITMVNFMLYRQWVKKFGSKTDFKTTAPNEAAGSAGRCVRPSRGL